MCGICGFVTEGSKADPAILSSMNEMLTQRGPDEEGEYVGESVALGARRLAIIDLASGQQPMSNEDGSLIVVQNGEIYNFEELRTSLMALGHVFTTNSDTEVIVHLYEEYGDSFVNQLNGMFAIAIWDSNKNRVVLARDRMGQKPLYWTRIGAGIAFASELKSLLAHPDASTELDPRSLSRYLFYEYLPAPWSIFHGVFKLPAGHLLVFENSDVAIEKYWIPPEGTNNSISLHEAGNRLWDQLCRSVEMRLMSEVPLGVFLSGGIDSSAIVAAMAECRSADTIDTYTIGFEDKSFDESRHARLIAEHFGTRHHERMFSAPHLLELLPDVADYLDEPFGDASVLPMHLLSQFAREDLTVALGGDGGDELMAGYPTFQAIRAASIFRAMPRSVQSAITWLGNCLPVNHKNFSFDFKVKQFLRGAGRGSMMAHQIWLGSVSGIEMTRLFSDSFLERLDAFDIESEHQSLIDSITGKDLVDKLTRLYSQTYLAEDILTKGDRATMATSLELRAPFMDHQLVEFVSSLHSHYKLKGKSTKRILREALKGRVPDAILNRPKKGFGIPISRWLQSELKELTQRHLNPERLNQQGIFRPAVVSRMLNQHWSGTHNHRKALWTMLMFQLWYDRYYAYSLNC